MSALNDTFCTKVGRGGDYADFRHPDAMKLTVISSNNIIIHVLWNNFMAYCSFYHSINCLNMWPVYYLSVMSSIS